MSAQAFIAFFLIWIGLCMVVTALWAILIPLGRRSWNEKENYGK